MGANVQDQRSPSTICNMSITITWNPLMDCLGSPNLNYQRSTNRKCQSQKWCQHTISTCTLQDLPSGLLCSGVFRFVALLHALVDALCQQFIRWLYSWCFIHEQLCTFINCTYRSASTSPQRTGTWCSIVWCWSRKVHWRTDPESEWSTILVPHNTPVPCNNKL